MPSATLTANSTGALTEWNIGAGTRPSLINSDDDGTSFIQKNFAGVGRDTYGLTALPPADAVSNLIIYFKIARAGGGSNSGYVFCRQGAVNGSYSSAGSTVSGVYAWKNKNDFGRPGGGSWVPSDFMVADTTQMGIMSDTGDASTYLLCTCMYMTLDYIPPSGVWSWLIGQWLPPLLAVASHAIDKKDAIQILNNLKVRPSSDEDFARLLGAFNRRPVYAY